ncbi:MAG: fatty acid desaturase [Candidatus Marinimicrobia bacterium]|nr:fatty acid desaturase [Candidatus Neomarinimicrobiota bacterium]
MKKFRLLREPIDIISVFAIVLVLTLQTTALTMGWPWYTFLLIVALIRLVNLVEHNLSHKRIFYQSYLNELLGWMCYLSNGVPLEFYEMHHVKNHHKFNQLYNEKVQDWSSLYGFRGTNYPDKPINKTYYVLTFPLMAICHCLLEIVRNPGSKMFWRFIRSSITIVVSSAILISINPIGFLFFFIIPWGIVAFALGSNNYNHHIGCKMTNDFDSSNSDLRFLNRLPGFNIGYHVSHHIKPSLHWSRLPEYHAGIREKIPTENLK